MRLIAVHHVSVFVYWFMLLLLMIMFFITSILFHGRRRHHLGRDHWFVRGRPTLRPPRPGSTRPDWLLSSRDEHLPRRCCNGRSLLFIYIVTYLFICLYVYIFIVCVFFVLWSFFAFFFFFPYCRTFICVFKSFSVCVFLCFTFQLSFVFSVLIVLLFFFMFRPFLTWYNALINCCL